MASDAIIPFTANGHGPRFSTVRIVEAIVIALLCGGLSVYATQQVLGVKVDNNTATLIEIKNDIKQIKSDFYYPVVKHPQNVPVK